MSLTVKLPYNSSYTDGKQQLSTKIIADVFPHWHWVNTQLNALVQRSAKTPAFIEVVVLAHAQLIKYMWFAASSCYLLS